MCARDGHILAALALRGADVNAAGAHGETILHLVAGSSGEVADPVGLVEAALAAIQRRWRRWSWRDEALARSPECGPFTPVQNYFMFHAGGCLGWLLYL